MLNLLLRLVLMAVAIFVGAQYVPGVAVADFQTALIASVVLGVLNTFVKPILKILTLPITILTLGVFLLVINCIMVLLTAYFVSGFSIAGWGAGILFTIVLTLTSFILNKVLD